MERNTGYYRIDVAASMSGLTVHRVRTYVRQGLIAPARYEERQMVFEETQLAQLRRIRRLSDDLGMNAAGVEVVLRLLDEVARLQAQLDERGPR